MNYGRNPQSENLWESIGFHRQLAGFWYKLVFMLFHVVVGMAVGMLIYPIMFPFPEILGYYSTSTSIFIAIFVAFDLGTANLMNRFIGEHGSSNPRKMLHYIQYFIWYQMFTGLIQVTIISIWALFVPIESMLYFTWIFIFYSLVQYPAMQSVFRNVLESLQQFNKSQVLDFLGGDVFQKSLEVIFVILFRYTLGTNPCYGTILAATIGLVFGKYLDDFISMIVGMKLFSNTIGKYDIKVKDCFRHDFNISLIKETFIYGFKTGFPGVISGFFSLLILTWWLSVPQYTTFIALFSLGASIVNFIQGLKINLGGAIAESYLNGKKKLCQYYIGQTWRFNALIQILFYTIIFAVLIVLSDVLVAFGLSNYLLSIPFIIPLLIRRFIDPYIEQTGVILTSGNKPTEHLLFSIIELVLTTITWYVFLVVLRLPHVHGYSTIIWLIPAGDIGAVLFVRFLAYLYIHKKMFHIKIPLWQTFGGNTILSIGIMGITFLYYLFIYIPMKNFLGTIIAILPMALIFCILIPVFVWMPLTVLLGVWDDGSIASFKDATKISGIAKVLVIPMYKGIIWAVQHSKLHNKFKMEESEALKEARELMEIKRSIAKKVTRVKGK
ncbi:MAG: hypothetical protein ACTSYS_13005 [Promethearchaeota archaeon]